jgi:hypothetical protein
MSAAESFRTGGEFKSPDGTYFVAWPPFFPIVLSLLPDAPFVIVIFHTILKCLAGVLLYQISRRLLTSKLLNVTFLLVSLCGVHLTMISVFLWSELLFLVLMLTNFFIAISLDKIKFGLPLLLITGFLLCLQRNAGVFYISGVSLWLLLGDHTQIRKRILHSFALFCFSLSGWLLWINYIDSVSDEFQFSAYRLFENPLYNLHILLTRLGELFITGPPWVLKIASIVVAGSCLYILWPDVIQRQELRLMLIVTVSYFFGLSILGKLDPHELDRLLSVFIPFVYLFVFAAMDKMAGRVSVPTLRFSLIILILWCCYPILRTAENVSLWHNRSCFSVLNK